MSAFDPKRTLTERLFCRDICCSDDRPPFVDFRYLVRCECCWVLLIRRKYDLAERFETLPHGRVGQGSLDGDLEPIDDVVGRPLCRPQAVPEGDPESRPSRC